jgi:hypothetical protein
MERAGKLPLVSNDMCQKCSSQIQKLVAFVDGLLLKLSAELPAANSPTPGGWKLTRNGSEEDLSKWKPSTLDTKTPIFIISGVQDHLPLVRTTFAAQSETWAWARQTKSFILPLGAAFLLQSDTHILVSLLCQTRVKVFGKKKKIHESRHSVLIPIGYTVSDVLGLIRSSSICGIYQEPHEDNLRLDRRSVGELGWTNGTVLRLELW